MTAPASGTAWASVSCASPVPGGMSTTRQSSSPQSTSRSSWLIADMTIGPRQIIASSSPTRKPIDMALRPNARIGLQHRTVALGSLAAEAEQARQRGAVDVGIENADLPSERGQSQREIHRRRRLADAALAGRDGDDATRCRGWRCCGAGAGARRGGRPAGPSRRAGLAAAFRRHLRGEADDGVGDAVARP